MPSAPNAKILVEVSDVWFNNGNPGMRLIEKHMQNTLKIFDKDTIEFSAGGLDDPDDRTKKAYHFNTNHVTIKQFIDAVVDFETLTRPKYCPGFLVFYRNFEGIFLRSDGSYDISWER